MYCSKCGNQVPDESLFCLRCGNELGKNTGEVSKPSSGGALIAGLSIGAIALILLVALIVGIGIAYYNNESKKHVTETSQPQPAIQAQNPIATQVDPVRPPERIAERTTIVDKTFPVSAQQYVYYTIPLSGPSTHVTGHFTAQGGANDIEVLILDADGFTNFSNKHSAQTYYNSGGYVTTGSIDLHLATGTYYVVFNNSRSILTNKVVTAKIETDK